MNFLLKTTFLLLKILNRIFMILLIYFVSRIIFHRNYTFWCMQIHIVYHFLCVYIYLLIDYLSLPKDWDSPDVRRSVPVCEGPRRARQVTGTTSAPIGACKCNFPPFYEILTDRPTNRRGQREVTLPIKKRSRRSRDLIFGRCCTIGGNNYYNYVLFP